MNNIKEYNFSDLYEMGSGISSKPEQAGHGAPFVSFSTVFNNYFLPDKVKDLMDTSEEEQETYSIKSGDILLTRTSETIDELGMSCVALSDYPQATFSGFVKRLRPTQTNVTYPKFMGFYLRSKFFRKTMTNNAVLTLRASLNEDIFSYLKLYLPHYETQKKIGDFLYSLNAKIEINNRINAELEAMAKTIYDYWFVQFDFPISAAQAASMGKPDKKGKSYKASGGKMVWSEELKIEIPEGWEAGTLSNISELIRGVTYSAVDIKDKSDKDVVPILRATNITRNVIDLQNMVYVPKEFVDEKQILNQFDILITMSSGSKDHIGKNGFYYFDEKAGFGAFCAKIVAKENYRFYLYSYTQSDFMFTTIRNECLGTNINNLNGSLVNGFRLAIPPKDLIDKFNSKIEPMFNKIGINQKENQRLTELRDWLLPMLMNGQIKIKDAEQELAMAAEPEVDYGPKSSK